MYTSCISQFPGVFMASPRRHAQLRGLFALDERLGRVTEGVGAELGAFHVALRGAANGGRVDNAGEKNGGSWMSFW